MNFPSLDKISGFISLLGDAIFESNALAEMQLSDADLIKEESSGKNITDMTINDFVPEKIVKYEEYFQKKIINSTIALTRKSMEESLRKTYPTFSFSDLKEERLDECNKLLDEHARKLADQRLKAFRRGETIGKIIAIQPSKNFNFVVTPLDFKNSENASFNLQTLHKSQSQTYTNLLANAELRATYSRKFEQKKLAQNVQGMLSIFDDVNKLFTSGSFVDDLHSQVKFYIAISNSLDKPFEEIKEDDIRFSLYLGKKIAQDHLSEKERKAEEAAQKLLALESSSCSKAKKPKNNAKQPQSSKTQKQEDKTNKKTNEKESKKEIVAPSAQKAASFSANVSKLNTMKPLYGLDDRVRRWGTDLAKIKNFTYFDHTEKKRVKRYASYSDDQLLHEKNCHNLAGIEKLLSQPQLKQKYTFPYTYFDKNSQKTRTGLGIYSVKIDQKKNTETGITYIGIGENNVIYHAAFVPVAGRNFLPEKLIQVLDSEKDDSEEEKWDLVSDCTFSALDEQIIQMEIGKKDKVTFHFYPLK